MMRDNRSIRELRGAVARARRDPDTLAAWLHPCTTAALCRRLACEETAALALQLYGYPDPYRWWTDLRLIGAAVQVDPAALHALLTDATQRRDAAQPCRTADPGGRGADDCRAREA
jgi:hypothetical protein